MKLENINIIAIRSDYMIVKADSQRFGEQEVMFEGNTFDQCFDYVKREIGAKRLNLQSYLLYELITDRNGRSFPCEMHVCD